MAQVSQRVSDKITHAHVITCFSVCCFLTLSSSSLSRASTFLSLSTSSLSCSSTSMWSKPARNKSTALTHNEEYCPVAIHNPLTESVFPFSDNLITLMFNVAGDLTEHRERLASSLSLKGMNITTLPLKQSDHNISQFFCTPKSSMENPA